MSPDDSVEAEFCGSLTVTEQGDLLPTRDRFGNVVDRFGTYRAVEDESQPKDRELRFFEGREL